ncbi:ankyrin repeat domain-containing protein, partial [bacterium]|nr:ankyrin repeat domain-containing protein [bacterium]
MDVFQVIQSGNNRGLERMLSNGLDIHAWRDGHTPLHLAAELGESRMVERLLRRGAYVNQYGPDGE